MLTAILRTFVASKDVIRGRSGVQKRFHRMSWDLIAGGRKSARTISPLTASRPRVPLLVLAGLFAAMPALAQDSPRSRGFYANVVITTQDDLSLEFLNDAVASVDDCK